MERAHGCKGSAACSIKLATLHSWNYSNSCRRREMAQLNTPETDFCNILCGEPAWGTQNAHALLHCSKLHFLIGPYWFLEGCIVLQCWVAFPLVCSLPTHSCMLASTQIHQLPKVGRILWKQEVLKGSDGTHVEHTTCACVHTTWISQSIASMAFTCPISKWPSSA